MAALSSTVHISFAKALAPKATKRAVAVKAAARADSNNEVRLPPENHRGWLREHIIQNPSRALERERPRPRRGGVSTLHRRIADVSD